MFFTRKISSFFPVPLAKRTEAIRAAQTVEFRNAELGADQKPQADKSGQNSSQPVLNKILSGLPGFLRSTPRLLRDSLPSVLGGAAAVAAVKCSVGALCAATSAPAILSAGLICATGAVASQTLSYIRARQAELDTDYLQKAGPMASERRASMLRSLTVEFNSAVIRRELSLFGSHLKSSSFWKGAAVKGAVGTTIGAGLGALATNEAVHDAAHKAVSALRGWTGQIFSSLSGPTLTLPEGSRTASGFVTVLTTEPAAATPVTADLVAPSPAQETPLSLSDKVRALVADHPAQKEALEKILAQSQLSEAQRVKDIAVGLGNGAYGFTVDKDAAHEALRLAAEAGNAQAVRDLALNGAPLPAALDMAPEVAPAVEPVPAPPSETLLNPAAGPAAESSSDVPLAAPGIDEETRTRALDFARANNAAAEAELSPQEQFSRDYALDRAPRPVGGEAARCILGVGRDGSETPGKGVIQTLCSVFKSVVTPDDHVLMQSADQSLAEKYAPVETQDAAEFATKARRDFRDLFFLPAFRSQLN